MDNSKGYEETIAATSRLLQQKGYRGNFTFVAEDGIRDPQRHALKRCLEEAVRIYLSCYKRINRFSLYTFAYYKTDEDNIQCTFRLSLDDEHGFRIKGLEITDARSASTQQFRYDQNRQVQPAPALKGYFPRPKPWEFWKKKFKP